MKKSNGGLYPVAENIGELLALHDTAFVDCVYKTLLGRTPDSPGLMNYLKMIRAGVSKMRVVASVALSAEARMLRHRVPGMTAAIISYGLASSRITGWLYRPLTQAEGETPLERRVRAIENAVVRLVESREMEVEEMDAAADDVDQLLQALAARRSA